MELYKLGDSKILIVEEEIIVAEDIKQQLENKGYDITGIVNNGRAAIEKVKETKPDLILMDITLQGELDGIETAQQIRNVYNIPHIYLTVYTEDKIMEKAKKTQPSDFIKKPFDKTELENAIEILV